MKDIRIDYTNRIFSRLTCIRFEGVVNLKTKWLCRCVCGVERIVNITNVVSGITKSCGCLKAEGTRFTGGHNKTHGLSKSIEYKAWRLMQDRCYNKNKEGYINYGGRGIMVCVRWVDSFEAFLSDMGMKPSPKHSIERMDVNGNYEPSNCKWATSHEQNRNKRTNVWAEAFGKRMIVSDWGKELNIKNLYRELKTNKLEDIIKSL